MTLPASVLAIGLLSGCGFGGASVTGDNLYAKLAEGGIYCANEGVEQPMSYIERADGTTESASPYPWTYADCDTESYSFSIRMYGSRGDLDEALSGCALGDQQGFVSRGSDWIAFWGGLEPLDRRAADEISAALDGETVEIPALCDTSDEAARSEEPIPMERQVLVSQLMTQIGDEGLSESAKSCIRQGLGGFSTEELTTLRDGETDGDVSPELQDKVVDLLAGCMAE